MDTGFLVLERQRGYTPEIGQWLRDEARPGGFRTAGLSDPEGWAHGHVPRHCVKLGVLIELPELKHYLFGLPFFPCRVRHVLAMLCFFPPSSEGSGWQLQVHGAPLLDMGKKLQKLLEERYRGVRVHLSLGHSELRPERLSVGCILRPKPFLKFGRRRRLPGPITGF